MRSSFVLLSVQTTMLKQSRFLFLASIVLPIVFLSVGGCSGLFSGKKKPFEELMPNLEEVKPTFVGDCTYIGTYKTIAVHGYGLVVGLPDTGGEDAHSTHYEKVYDEMNRMGHQGIRTTLASPQTAVVEVVGYMRPGIQTGERFDVYIRLPQNTDTKNLRGGRLMPTKLSEMLSVGGTIRPGDTRAIAEGPIMVDDPLATETSNPSGLKAGKILGGAMTLESRSLSLISKMDSKSPFWNEQMAKAINIRFPLTMGKKGVATAKTSSIIFLDIHPAYANDIPRYIRVIQSIVFLEQQVQQLQRIERLKEELLHPDTAEQAAFQLEAIGKAGIEALQQALRSPNIVVRFHASTALAYLGDSTSAKVLAEIAQSERAFRAYALNALSVMKNDLEAESYLQDLLHVPSAETRYGAFRALKNRNPLDHTIRGEILGDRFGQFSYHSITTQTAPMVHITSEKYPEIVLFGANITLKQPFVLDAGPTIYVNGQTPGKVVITRLVTLGIGENRTVSNRLDEIIRAVADMGGTYPDVVQLVRQADVMRVLSCRLEMNCLPEPNRLYQRSNDNDPDAAVEELEKPKSFWERWNPKNIFTPNPGEKTSDYIGTVNTSSRD